MKHLILLLTAVLLTVSCSKSEDLATTSTVGESSTVALLKQRANPWAGNDYIAKAKFEEIGATRSTSSLSFSDYLGRSFIISNYPTASASNLKYAVIDTDSFFEDYASYGYLESWSNKATYFDRFAYVTDSETSGNRLVERASLGNIINSEFSVDLSAIEAYNEAQLEDTFDNFEYPFSESTFGELNVFVCDSIYEMRSYESIREKINYGGYLNPAFNEDLHNMHPSKLFNLYGPYVCTGFITGARANVTYAGRLEYPAGYSESGRIDFMCNTIDSSYTFVSEDSEEEVRDPDEMVADLATYMTEYSSMKYSMCFAGGNYVAIDGFAAVSDLGDSIIDFTDWISCANDPSTHTMVAFRDGGLTPIYGYVMADNLKDILMSYYTGDTATNTAEEIDLVEPYFSVEEYTSSSTLISSKFGVLFKIYLHTRFGDKLLIRNGSTLVGALSDDMVDAEIGATAEDLYSMSQIDVQLTSSSLTLDELPTYQDLVDNDYDIFNEAYMSKVVIDGVTYILASPTTADATYVAWVLFDEYIIADYEMAALVSRLPTADDVTLRDIIDDYTIYAL